MMDENDIRWPLIVSPKRNIQHPYLFIVYAVLTFVKMARPTQTECNGKIKSPYPNETYINIAL